MNNQPLKSLTISLDTNDIHCLELLIEHYWDDEAEHFLSAGAPADHVFHLLVSLAAVIGHAKRNHAAPD